MAALAVWAALAAGVAGAFCVGGVQAAAVPSAAAEALEAGGLRRSAIVRVRAVGVGARGGARADQPQPHRSPCVPGAVRVPLSCGRMQRPQLVPSAAQLESTILSVMQALAAMPPGAPLPRERTRTEPARLLLDGAYKEVVGPRNRDVLRRQRLLRKLLNRKLDPVRETLIGYGGRRLWGGEANLFY